jgi:hypothetical protein
MGYLPQRQLDWFFTSANWITDYPNSMVLPLAHSGSDHVPCVVHIGTKIPKAKKIRFENYWVDMPGFQQCVKESWAKISSKSHSSAILADKLKTLRYDLKKWQVSLSHLKLLIQNCNKVILALDSLEEHRPLYQAEFNFRKIVKIHLDDLLLAECNYWRKCCTIRWIKQGEDNTKKFHAMATERYRRNNIAMLKNDDGVFISDHQEMANLIWKSYKDRMGQSHGIDMQFNLASLLTRVEGFEDLTAPFEKKEMDDVIKEMPSDRAPGPDGFNGLFVKKCWPIIQNDFYRLAKEFHEGTVNLQNINESFITLVPKKTVPECVNDFRPISLTNVCLKFLTKLAANRLQEKILECIHKNQYGFLRNRSIQYCLAWSFGYLFLCQSSKKPTVILKLDFAKAFDTVEHEALLQVMKHKGFNKKWLDWAASILSTGTSSVLLNGIPGKEFICKRGVRQGDPLSPFYYLFGSDLLQSVVNDLLRQGLIQRPIDTYDPDFPIIQYADDTLLIVPTD